MLSSVHVLCRTLRVLLEPQSWQLSPAPSPSADPFPPPGGSSPSPTTAQHGGPCPSSSAFLPQVILKDLEVLAEIASSPAGQMDDPGPLDGPDLRVSHSELQVPTPGRAGLLKTPGESFLEGCSLGDPGNGSAQSCPGPAGLWAVPLSAPSYLTLQQPSTPVRDLHSPFSSSPCKSRAFGLLAKYKTIRVS